MGNRDLQYQHLTYVYKNSRFNRKSYSTYMYTYSIVVIVPIIWLYITVVVVVISLSVIVLCIFISFLLVTVGIIYNRMGSKIEVVISISFDGENISFDASHVMYRVFQKELYNFESI
jgi:uncharacterized membrane protein